MQMNYVPKHSRDHDDSEYISYANVDRIAKFNGNEKLACIQTLNFLISTDD